MPSIVDVLVLVMTASAGDQIQWQKAGVLEAAEVIAVNKAGLPGADGVTAGLGSILALGQGGGATSGEQAGPVAGAPSPTVVKVTAKTGAGVGELWQAIEEAVR